MKHIVKRKLATFAKVLAVLAALAISACSSPLPPLAQSSANAARAITSGFAGNVTIKAMANGKFVTADNAGTSPLIANRDTAQGWETFTLVPQGGDNYGLKAMANGKYVCADNAGTSPLIANRTAVGGWETFTLVSLGGDSYALKAMANGKFVSADNAGSSPLIANRDSAQGWETFTIVALGAPSPSPTVNPSPSPSPTPSVSPSPSVAPSPSPTVSPQPGITFLKASGQDLRGNYGQGDVVQLKGVNLGGGMLQEDWMSPLGAQDEWTARSTLIQRFGVQTTDALYDQYESAWFQASDLDNIQSYGLNMVRLPIYWENVMNRDGTMKANPWTKIDWFVNQCAARGLYVLLDLHGLPGGNDGWQSGGRIANELWSNPTYQTWSVNLWIAMATHYRGNPTVCGYDLMNEPVSNNPNLTNGQFYNTLYQAVRNVDPDHAIFIEDDINPAFGWTNVVYESHHYDFGDSTNGSAQMTFALGELTKISQNKARFNVPVYIGEYCFYDFNDVWSTWLSNLNSMGCSWSAWTYKVKGAMGNWGLFNTNNNPSPDLNNDSPATITAKWNQFTTANFNSNTTFQALIKKYAAKPAPAPIPGTIEAEAFTSMSGVQLETCSEGGQDVGWLDTGDYLTYSVNVQTAGNYLVEYRVAGKNGGALSLQKADGSNLGSLNVPVTGDWQSWTTISQTVTLQAGAQTLKLAVTAPGYNINWIKFTKVN